MIWLFATASQAQLATVTPKTSLSVTAVTPTATASATATATAEMTPTADALATIARREHNVLLRPIAIEAGLTHWADRTYPYGSTQWGNRAVHLGVEFVNPRHTPVLASADGVVLFAGHDSETMIGPRLDYYGNVVVLSHELRSLDGQAVFTLYAHLQDIEVIAGQRVEAGQALGTVGSSGVALGAHLHYEVRLGGAFDHRRTRNPALWLRNYKGRGLISGVIRDPSSAPIYARRLVARSDTLRREVYTYGGDEVNSDAVWRENFTVSDLPAGDYELVALKENGAIGFRETVTVAPGSTTFVDIVILD